MLSSSQWCVKAPGVWDFCIKGESSVSCWRKIFCPSTSLPRDCTKGYKVIPSSYATSIRSLWVGGQHSKLLFPSVREKDKYDFTKNESNSKWLSAQNDPCVTQFTLRSQKKEVSDQNTMFIGKIQINPKPKRLGRSNYNDVCKPLRWWSHHLEFEYERHLQVSKTLTDWYDHGC